MIIYSSYHDEYFEVEGRASKLIRGREGVKALAEWLLGYEISEIHIGLAGYFDAVFAADVWVKLNSGLVRLLFVDTPITLSETQWEKLIFKIDGHYVKYWGIKVKLSDKFDEVFSLITDKARIFNEEVEYIFSVNRYELQELLKELVVNPWDVLLMLDEGTEMHLYLLPRILLKYVKKKLKEYNISFEIIQKP